MTEAQFELLLAATREQYQELRAIHDALGRLRAISYAAEVLPPDRESAAGRRLR